MLAKFIDLNGPYREVIQALNMPASFVILDRVVWGVSALLSKLSARNHWRAILAEYRKDAPPATELGGTRPTGVAATSVELAGLRAATGSNSSGFATEDRQTRSRSIVSVSSGSMRSRRSPSTRSSPSTATQRAARLANRPPAAAELSFGCVDHPSVGHRHDVAVGHQLADVDQAGPARAATATGSGSQPGGRRSVWPASRPIEIFGILGQVARPLLMDLLPSQARPFAGVALTQSRVDHEAASRPSASAMICAVPALV